MYTPWTVKYKPKTLKEVVGNQEAKAKIIKWIQQWDKKPPKKRALLLYGPPGIGKTATIEALAKDLDMELVESNASDYRTRDAVQRFAGRASANTTLFGKKRLILFDELGGLTGKADRGGVSVITKIVKETMSPLILIANNAYDPKFSTLRRYCQLIEFKKPTRTQIRSHLKKICKSEGIETDKETLDLITERAGRDVRSAVNDLQALAEGKKHLTYEDVAWLGDRDRKEVIFKVLNAIFYAKDSRDAKYAVDMADVDLDMLFEWIYENLPNHVKEPNELAAAMDALSRADIYRGRIRKTQNWTLLRYFIDMMTAGVATSWSQRSHGWTPFRFPKRIGYLSRTKARRALLREIGMKIRRRCHISSSRAVNEVLPYIRVILENRPETAPGLARYFNFDEDTVEFLKES